LTYEFRWCAWNVEHIGEHGVTVDEAEYLICHARSPYPRRLGERKFLVRGQTAAGEYLQAIFIVDPDKTIFVIHARPLTRLDKWRFRRELK
jgi:hypothetical protein